MSTTDANSTGAEPPSRAALRLARRVLVKAGTSVVTNDDGRPSLTRLGAIVEQVAELRRSNVDVILVSSGAVGMGKRLLKTQARSRMTFADLQHQSDDPAQRDRSGSEGEHQLLPPSIARNSSFANVLSVSDRPHTAAQRKQTYDSACAAAGQFEMMNLYCNLFAQFDLAASQLLVTQADFQDDARKHNLVYAVERLLSVGIVPIVNENDAVSANLGYMPQMDMFSDNDGLAALCARSFGAEVCLLLTDVEGVYDRPPNGTGGDGGGAKLIGYYREGMEGVGIGEKSVRGRGGMQSKIDAALSAVKPGSNCHACVVASGTDLNSIRGVLGRGGNKADKDRRKPRGTLFVMPGTDLARLAEGEREEEERAAKGGGSSVSEEARAKAVAARTQARKLQSLPHETRRAVLRAVADALVERQDELLAANAIDLEEAAKNDTAAPLVRRLKLTKEKIATLAVGIRQLAGGDDPLGVVRSKRDVADGLVLSQITVPIGVLMIIFESRPDSLPQISSLALASGNGLLLKGGREAARSNEALHRVIGDAVEAGSGGEVSRDIIALVTSRGQVADMLALDDVIDLVIPRGSNALVTYIKSNTRIPVLGHADGVCHVYVDESASSDAACRIVVDAKTDYPSACNAMETLLLHRGTLGNGVAMNVLMSLRAAGVRCLGGPNAMRAGLCDVVAEEMKHEYGDLTCMVEVVESVDEAIEWIHKYGSGHTEAIVCDDGSLVGEEFLRRVDAACVFKNASTRFADGYRFGLGAEVGISTGRIHARGPVGVEGLLTTKWQLRSSGCDYVAEFSGESPQKVYTHNELM